MGKQKNDGQPGEDNIARRVESTPLVKMGGRNAGPPGKKS